MTDLWLSTEGLGSDPDITLLRRCPPCHLLLLFFFDAVAMLILAIDQPDLLTEHGITHIVSILEYDHCDYSEYENYHRLWISAEDSPDQNLLQQFERTNAFIERALADRGSVLVHCAMGVSRSATILCAYLMYKQSISFLPALGQLQEGRPLCAPNLGFVEQVRLS